MMRELDDGDNDNSRITAGTICIDNIHTDIVGVDFNAVHTCDFNNKYCY